MDKVTLFQIAFSFLGFDALRAVRPDMFAHITTVESYGMLFLVTVACLCLTDAAKVLFQNWILPSLERR